jgi:hypothetical protein
MDPWCRVWGNARTARVAGGDFQASEAAQMWIGLELTTRELQKNVFPEGKAQLSLDLLNQLSKWQFSVPLLFANLISQCLRGVWENITTPRCLLYFSVFSIHVKVYYCKTDKASHGTEKPKTRENSHHRCQGWIGETTGDIPALKIAREPQQWSTHMSNNGKKRFHSPKQQTAKSQPMQPFQNLNL